MEPVPNMPGISRIRRLDAVGAVMVVVSDMTLGLLFWTISRWGGGMAMARALAVGGGTIVLLLACHLPVLRLLRRLDEEHMGSSGRRAVMLTAARYSVVMLGVLWIFVMGTAAGWAGMPVCTELIIARWAFAIRGGHIVLAALVVVAVTAREAVIQRKARSRCKRAALTDALGGFGGRTL